MEYSKQNNICNKIICLLHKTGLIVGIPVDQLFTHTKFVSHGWYDPLMLGWNLGFRKFHDMQVYTVV